MEKGLYADTREDGTCSLYCDIWRIHRDIGKNLCPYMANAHKNGEEFPGDNCPFNNPNIPQIVWKRKDHLTPAQAENAALKDCLREMAEILDALPDDCKEWCPRFDKCVELDAKTGDMQCPLNRAKDMLK